MYTYTGAGIIFEIYNIYIDRRWKRRQYEAQAVLQLNPN